MLKFVNDTLSGVKVAIGDGDKASIESKLVTGQSYGAPSERKKFVNATRSNQLFFVDLLEDITLI